jgi:hypothetical protein
MSLRAMLPVVMALLPYADAGHCACPVPWAWPHQIRYDVQVCNGASPNDMDYCRAITNTSTMPKWGVNSSPDSFLPWKMVNNECYYPECGKCTRDNDKGFCSSIDSNYKEACLKLSKKPCEQNTVVCKWIQQAPICGMGRASCTQDSDCSKYHSTTAKWHGPRTPCKCVEYGEHVVV